MDQTPKVRSWGWWVLAYAGLALVILVGHRFVRGGLPGWFAGRVTKKATVRGPATSTAVISTSSTVSSADREKAHISEVKQLAREFEKEKGVPPRDIEELRAWAVAQGKAEAEDFISTRDGRPYDLISDAAGVVVMEQTGRSGKKFVSGLPGLTSEGDEIGEARDPPADR
jgi:hypothetical protein